MRATRSTTTSRPSRAIEEALADRLWVLTVARMATVALTVAVITAFTGGDSTGVRDVVVVASAVMLLAGAATLVVLRRSLRATRALRDGSLLVDAAWVGVVLWATGADASPFLVLVYLHLMATTVLFTWRTGLKFAILATLALLWAVVAAAAPPGGDPVVVGPVPISLDPDLGALGEALGQARVLFDIAALWLVGAATAMFSAVNERDLVQSNQELAVLREVNTELESSLDLADVSQAIARGVVRELGYVRAIVWMSQAGGELAPGGAAGFAPGDLETVAGLRLTVGPGPIGTSVERRHPAVVPRQHPRPAALADAFEIDSPLVVVPLVSEGRLLGLLTAEVPTPVGRAPHLKGRDLRILETLATEASLALDNARLHAELRDLSVTDALTGVYNHRHFQQRLQEELDRAVRKAAAARPKPVSLILMDIDFFKQVNDQFGHPSGDELLRSFARLSLRVLRSSDVVTRYGGEEFGIILPETAAEQARQVAERLREAVERSNFTGSDGRYLGQVTASFGIATYSEGLPSRSELIQRADEALYAAKEGGRNLVVADHELAGGSPRLSQAGRT